MSDVVLKLRVDGTKKQVTERVAALIAALQEKDDGFVSIIEAVIEEPIRFSTWGSKR